MRASRLALITLIALTTMITITTTSGAHADIPLSQYQWKNRVIILIADQTEAGQQQLQVQREKLQSTSASLEERDLIILEPIAEDSELHAELNPENAPFKAILIGKDGGVKRQWNDTFDPSQLYKTIDAMPMRQREMEKAQ